MPARPATSISFREQLNAIKWDDKERDRKARRSRREYSNRDFVDKQQLPLLFEAMTLGMMVHTPDDPVEVRSLLCHSFTTEYLASLQFLFSPFFARAFFEKKMEKVVITIFIVKDAPSAHRRARM